VRGVTSDAAATVEDRIKYHFRDAGLLAVALTHASASPAKNTNNERLEFLGDRVLALVLVEELYYRHPDASEGELARRLNALVRAEMCAQVFRTLDIVDVLAAARSSWGKAPPSSINVLADMCEALIGAVYLDGGIEAARQFVLAAWAPHIALPSAADKDPKTALQEWAMGHALPVPVYVEQERTGPDHEPFFSILVYLKGFEPAAGGGPSKRRAEQVAAESFLRREMIWK
jgi:ribonuclease III